MEYYKQIQGAKAEVHQPKHIAVIRIGNSTLNRVELNIQPPFHLELETADIDGFYETFQGKAFPTNDEPEDKPWGVRTFSSCDPEGNTLEFSKSLRE